jgi:hypothetical protein
MFNEKEASKPKPPEEGWSVTEVVDEWEGYPGEGGDSDVWVATAPGFPGVEDIRLSHLDGASYVVSPHAEHRDGSTLRIWGEELGWLTPQQWVGC